MHRLPVRVYYEDTDAAGIVYHANYLRFAERGRTELLRSLGFEHASLFKEKGVAFAVTELTIKFHIPAKLDDLLVVQSEITHIGGARMTIQQTLTREDKLLTSLDVSLACLDKNGKAVRLPDDVRRMVG